MADIKACDRCKKRLTGENDIGMVAQLEHITIIRGYIRPAPKLLELAKESDPMLEYLPLTFHKGMVKHLDLCSPCLLEFMSFTKNSLTPTK